jgi:hypothetical protein
MYVFEYKLFHITLTLIKWDGAHESKLYEITLSYLNHLLIGSMHMKNIIITHNFFYKNYLSLLCKVKEICESHDVQPR